MHLMPHTTHHARPSDTGSAGCFVWGQKKGDRKGRPYIMWRLRYWGALQFGYVGATLAVALFVAKFAPPPPSNQNRHRRISSHVTATFSVLEAKKRYFAANAKYGAYKRNPSHLSQEIYPSLQVAEAVGKASKGSKQAAGMPGTRSIPPIRPKWAL